MRFAMANRPTLGEFVHSCCHSTRHSLLALRLALARVTLKGVCHSRDVASLTSSSALSLPGISQWLGHHDIDRVISGFSSSTGVVATNQIFNRLQLEVPVPL